MAMMRGVNSSLARTRAIRSAVRSRRGKVLSRSSSRTSSARTNTSSRTQSTMEAKQTKQIALYEEVQKASDELLKTAKALIDLGSMKTDSNTTTSNTTTEATNTTTTNAESTAESKTTQTTTETQKKEKTEEEQKKEIIDGIKELVEQYNIIYGNLEEIGGSVNTLFAGKLKKVIVNCEETLKKTGVLLNRNGTLSVTTKTLESTDLNTLKDVYCKSTGVTDKLMEKAEYIESNAASTITVINRMYGTQTYNRYGTGNTYYGSSGSWYNSVG